jgi:hypothetical protein
VPGTDDSIMKSKHVGLPNIASPVVI